MSHPDRYIPGVPCWVDTTQPDPEAAVAFYGGLFGWELEDTMPPGRRAATTSPDSRGGDVAAVSSQPEGGPPAAVWNTYVWVTDADETTDKVRAAGGDVLSSPWMSPTRAGWRFSPTRPGPRSASGRRAGTGAPKLVNEHGALNFNDLRTRDLDGARSFYGTVSAGRSWTWEGARVGAARLRRLPRAACARARERTGRSWAPLSASRTWSQALPRSATTSPTRPRGGA